MAFRDSGVVYQQSSGYWTAWRSSPRTIKLSKNATKIVLFGLVLKKLCLAAECNTQERNRVTSGVSLFRERFIIIIRIRPWLNLVKADDDENCIAQLEYGPLEMGYITAFIPCRVLR